MGNNKGQRQSIINTNCPPLQTHGRHKREITTFRAKHAEWRADQTQRIYRPVLFQKENVRAKPTGSFRTNRIHGVARNENVMANISERYDVIRARGKSVEERCRGNIVRSHGASTNRKRIWKTIWAGR